MTGFDREDSMNRTVRPDARAAVLALLIAVPSLAAAAPASGDVTGIWWASSYSPSIKTYLAGGGDVPLNDAGKKKYAENQAGLKDGSIIDRARVYCTPDGLPRTLATPYPFQIIVAPPGQMSWVYEQNTMIRGISMVKPLDSLDKLSVLPFWNGHSAGHWDGDTLVIESGGFNESTFIDATGVPHSDQMMTTERVRKINGGKQLEDVITLHDPVYYTRDWQARFVYDNHDGMRLMEYICGEPHRDISNIKGVKEARAANAARAAGR
ncbi:MAG TPA: hypothetical protein VHT51_11035 [Micropepsaceae bacterium]|jgi:hypothetical protein|nr:hypothetical protein [Micropepsaceae bacterium]